MKDTLRTPDRSAAYRATQSHRVIAAARRYGIDLIDKTVLDLGCNTGALTRQYAREGARHVIGVDIDAHAVETARATHSSPSIEFRWSTATALPIADSSIDVILCYDVFEHIAHPQTILDECRRVLRPHGKMLIGTWGWHHPFAPHLWATMPVPWSHVIFSERTILRTCRRVFHSPWYVPTMHDLDEHGQKKTDRYTEEAISTEYLNKFLIRDFERVFDTCGMSWQIHLEPFSSKFARWTKVLLRSDRLREFFAAYVWAVLENVPRPSMHISPKDLQHAIDPHTIRSVDSPSASTPATTRRS